MTACEEYCRQQGLNLVRDEEYTFLDRGLSGYKAEHLGDSGQLARFLRLVKDGTIERGSTLVVESLDRLSREHVKTALPRFIDLLNDGIHIVTLTDGRRYTSDFTEMDLIMSIFVMSRAYEESSTKSRRLRDAMKAKHDRAREHNIPMGAAIPLWLKLSDDRKRFEVLPERVKVVRRVFEMAIDGYGKAVTAKALNVEGIPSFKGKQWGSSSIDKMLNNRAVLGEYQPYSVRVSSDGIRQAVGEPIKGYYPAIIKESMFYAAQGAIAGRKLDGTTRQSENINLWSGIAKCAECGTAMHLVKKGRSPKGGTYLQCYRARKGLCVGKLVRLEGAELVLKHLLKRLDSMALVQDNRGKIGKDLKEVEGRLVSKRDYLARNQSVYEQEPNAFVSKIISQTLDEISTLEREKEQLQAELATERVNNWQEFLRRLELELLTREGRLRANALLKRLKVVVYIARRKVSEEGYYVTEKGESIYVMAHRNGKVGHLLIEGAGAYEKESAGIVIDQLLGMMSRNLPFIRA
jgi:DNA invertase Pin-like site-specific DNA recombinase